MNCLIESYTSGDYRTVFYHSNCILRFSQETQILKISTLETKVNTLSFEEKNE